MILFFYNVALFVVLVAGAPLWLWRMATTRKYREGLMARLGRVPPELAESAASISERPIIWLHAVSVGEVLAITRLVKALEAAVPTHRIVISTTTYTGQELAREQFGIDRVFYCPLDLPWAVSAYLDALNPGLLILTETELWPNLLNGCFSRSIPVAVVNARISDRSWPRYRRLRGLWRPFLENLNRVLAQTQTDADRLIELGCDPDRVSVAGNLKFDVRIAEEAEVTRVLKSLTTGLRFIVAGSTLESEEAALLEAWPHMLSADPKLVMVLAPRHPERFAAVATLLEKSGKLWCKRSGWNTRPARPLRPGEIVLLDTIGELASVYSLASVAFVGGSLVPAGGHNPLEPAQFGTPIVMGPYYANFAAITDSLREANALRIANREDLATAMIGLLDDRTTAVAMGARAIEVFDRQSGATGRCVREIRQLLAESEPATRDLSFPDPAIAAEERRLREQREEIESTLRLLRNQGKGAAESVAILRSIFGKNLMEVKQAIDKSETWRAVREALEAEIDGLTSDPADARDSADKE